MYGLAAILRAYRNEFLGWRKFKQYTDVWPVLSTIATLLSGPTFLGMGGFVFVNALGTRKLPLIYISLLVAGTGLPLLWYAIRYWCRTADVRKAVRYGLTDFSADAAGRLIK